MNKKIWKRIGIASGSVLVVLSIVLGVHIYSVKQGRKPNANTISLARVDIQQPLSASEKEQIRHWFATQNGVSHAVFNDEFNNIVFSYAPMKVNADALIQQFVSTTKLKATRYMPSTEQMKAGCPVM